MTQNYLLNPSLWPWCTKPQPLSTKAFPYEEEAEEKNKAYWKLYHYRNTIMDKRQIHQGIRRSHDYFLMSTIRSCILGRGFNAVVPGCE